MKTSDKLFQAYRQLEPRRVVRLIGKYRKGEYGVVVENLTPQDMTGGARYAVRLDHSGHTADMLRCELSGIKDAKGKPEYRTA